MQKKFSDVFLIASAMACAMGLMACSRKEKPAAPAKQVRSIAVAPTPAAQIAEANSVVPAPEVKIAETNRLVIGQEARVTGTNTIPPLSRNKMASAPVDMKARHERQKALKERQKAFAKKVNEEALVKKQVELSRCEQDLIRAEHALRSEGDVAAALGEIERAAALVESECVRNVPGFAALLKGKSDLEAKLSPDSLNGANADPAAIKETVERLETLATAIGESRRKAAVELPVVAEANYRLGEKENLYKQLIMGKTTYRSSREKTDAVRAEILALKKTEEN